MRDLVVLFLHLLTTVARLDGPGGARFLVAESVLVKHQLLILNRSRKQIGLENAAGTTAEGSAVVPAGAKSWHRTGGYFFG